jgi:hypothetical protein
MPAIRSSRPSALSVGASSFCIFVARPYATRTTVLVSACLPIALFCTLWANFAAGSIARLFE